MKNIKLLNFFVLFSVLTLFACGKLCFDNKIIHIEQQSNNSNKLKLNGYYKATYPYKSDTTFIINIFYTNGVYLTCPIFIRNGNSENYNSVLKFFNDSSYTKDRTYYGLYEIKNDTLLFEGFHVSLNGDCFPAYLNTALILNDTTFVVIKEEDSKKPKYYKTLSDTFYFHQAVKPDSTNPYFP